jgi:N6-adenosine-specific RNA methylase IME4
VTRGVPFQIVVADPPWSFNDKLRMSSVKRGAAANYATMSDDVIVALGATLQGIVADNACLALWVPASKIDVGLRVMRAWGFAYKTKFEWVKGDLAINESGGECDVTLKLAFGMGRYFRAASEPCLFGVRGKFQPTGSRSERNVVVSPPLPHSTKPEALQDRLERMYPGVRALEMFARRTRPGWCCCGLECPDTKDEDIHATLQRLKREVQGQ